jgi:hypothetical protein
MGERTIVGWLLPAGANVEPQQVVVVDHYKRIADLIGADLVDAVYNRVASSDGDHADIVGYVDDEGLFDPEKKINVLATVLFGRDEPRVGDCVVFSSTNADGENDGENYDMPPWLAGFSDQLVMMAAHLWNKTIARLLAVSAAVEAGIVDESEVMDAVHNDDVQGMAELGEVSERYVRMVIDDIAEGRGYHTVDDVIQNLLGDDQ